MNTITTSVLFSLFVVFTVADVCTFTKNVAVPFDNVLECFDALPFNSGTFKQTMETVSKAGQLYVFKDIAKNSPGPIFTRTNVDFDKELAIINGTKYTSDFGYNKDLTALFRKFHDGHFSYVPPDCFSGLTAILPFVMVSYFDENEGREVIYISDFMPKAVDAYKSLYNIDVTEALGGTIVSINNEPAVKVVMDYANNTLGMSHDVNIRYNIALARYSPDGSYSPGQYFARSYGGVIPPKNEVLTFSVKTAKGAMKSYSLKWITIPSVDLASTSALQNSCNSKLAAKEAIPLDGRVFDNAPRIPTSQMAKEMRSKAIPKTSDVIISNEDCSFIQIDADTAVLVIPAFAPVSNIRFGRSLTRGFQEMYDRGLTRIILDLSNNGGGIVCWGYTLAHLLMGEYNPFGRADMPVVPLSLAYAQSAIDNNVHGTMWSPDTWHEVNSTNTLPFNMDWFVPGFKHVRGGVEGTYSTLFRDQCDILYTVMHLPEGMTFKPSQIKILTNGFCGSTCCFFSRHLQESYNVATFAIGGINYIPMTIGTSPGNQVLDVATTIVYATKLGMKNHPLSPPGFPNNAQMSYTLREVYPWTPTARDIPLDYYFQPSTYHLSYTKESAVDQTKAWEQVLEFFA